MLFFCIFRIDYARKNFKNKGERRNRGNIRLELYKNLQFFVFSVVFFQKRSREVVLKWTRLDLGKIINSLSETISFASSYHSVIFTATVASQVVKYHYQAKHSSWTFLFCFSFWQRTIQKCIGFSEHHQFMLAIHEETAASTQRSFTQLDGFLGKYVVFVRSQEYKQ